MKINLRTLKCLRCGFRWVPRKSEVRQCPKCKSAYWDVPRKDVEDGQALKDARY